MLAAHAELDEDEREMVLLTRLSELSAAISVADVCEVARCELGQSVVWCLMGMHVGELQSVANKLGSGLSVPFRLAPSAY